MFSGRVASTNTMNWERYPIDGNVSINSSKLTNTPSSVESSIHSVAAHQQTLQDGVTRLNNKGVAYMECAKFTEAEFHLRRAMDLALIIRDSMTPPPSLLMTKKTLSFPTATSATTTSSSAVPTMKPIKSSSSSSLMSLFQYMEKHTSAANLNTKKEKKCMYQQRDSEYDEGMNIFLDPIPIIADRDCYSISSMIHASLVTILFNYGILYLRLKDEETALDFFYRAFNLAKEEAEQQQRRIYGNGGEIIIAILHNIGRTQYRNGNYQEAILTYTKALEYGTASYSRAHNFKCMIETAATLNCLGVVHFHLPDNDDDTMDDDDDTADASEKVMAFYTQSLDMRRSVIGRNRDDSNVATTLNNIGRVYFKKGQYVEALRVYDEALNMRRRIYGDDHLDVAVTLYNAGQTYHKLKNLTNAMDYYTEFLNIAKKHLGVNNRDVAIVLKCMAQLHQEQKDYDQATALFKESLVVAKSALGPYHEEIASILNKLGNLLYEKGDLDGAANVYKQGLEVERAVLNVYDHNIGVTLTNLGQIYSLTGSYKRALRYYKEAILIQRHSKGNAHPNFSATLSSIGLLYYQTKSYAKALTIYQEVLRIQQDNNGDDSMEVATTLNSIGLVFSEMKLPKYALEAFQQSLRIRRALLGHCHRDIAIVLYNIATIYLEIGDDDEALSYYKQTLVVEREVIKVAATTGNDCEQKDLVVTIEQIGHVHQKRGELDAAIKFFSEALDIQKRIAATTTAGPREQQNAEDANIAIAQTLNNLGNVYLQKGQTKDMVFNFSECLRFLRLAGENGNKLIISGMKFYALSKLHPECAPVA